MDKHDKIIKDANKNTVEDIIMSLQNTQMGKYFNVPLYRFIWQVLAGIIAIVSLWYMLVGRVDANEKDIKTIATEIVGVKSDLKDHLIEVKNAPTTTVEIRAAVKVNTKEIDEINTLIHAHDKAVTKNETTIDIVRADQVIMQKDIKEILKLIKQNGN